MPHPGKTFILAFEMGLWNLKSRKKYTEVHISDLIPIGKSTHIGYLHVFLPKCASPVGPPGGPNNSASKAKKKKKGGSFQPSKGANC